MKYIDAEYVKAVMINDRLMQGNAEFTLYAQVVERQVNALPSIEIIRCRECKYWIGETEHYEDREYKACWQLCGQYTNSEFWCKYGEREGER